MDPSYSLAAAMRLPLSSRVIESTRDFIIVKIPCFRGAHQFGVLWDPRREEYVLTLMTALSYRSLNVRNEIIALSALRGNLTVYFNGDTADAAAARARIQVAADVALKPCGERLEVLPLELCPMTRTARGDAILDRAALPAGHPLLIFPANFQLGRVAP